MTLYEIFAAIDAHDNGNGAPIRLALGEKIRERLFSRGDSLTDWERTHMVIAADLLSARWLRLAWAHVNMALAEQGAGVEQFERVLPDGTEVPSLSELNARLDTAFALIKSRYATKAAAPRAPRLSGMRWFDFAGFGGQRRAPDGFAE